MPAVLVAGHAPFTWGRSVAEAAHHAVVLEEVAKRPSIRLRLTPAPSLFPKLCWTNTSFGSTEGTHIMDKLRSKICLASVALLTAGALACSSERASVATSAKAPKISWGMTPSGDPVDLYTLNNKERRRGPH